MEEPCKRRSTVISLALQQIETEIYRYVKELWKEKKKVSRLIILRKVLEINPLFKGGRANNPKWFKCIKNWFYHGFCRRYNLSYTRVAGVSRKLPPNWKELHGSIVTWVAKSQTPRKEGHLVIHHVPDEQMGNTDHIPMYRDMAGSYSWTKKGVGGGSKKSFVAS